MSTATRMQSSEWSISRSAKTDSSADALSQTIRSGLMASPKRLPAALLYDDLGSTLFDAITMLPEYGVTKADVRLIEAHASDVVRAMGEPIRVVELGPGNGGKAKMFLEAALDLQPELSFTAIDVSLSALESCRRTLEVLPDVDVELVRATYLEGLAQVPREGGKRLILFLGSNLSNFERSESRAFLSNVHARLAPGEGILIATDLEKPKAKLLRAYDDAIGVTSAFNKNVLARLNREWAANFDLSAFTHEVRYLEAERRIEMHLRANRPMRVNVAALDVELSFAEGETIWTESSHRFAADELRTWGEEAGFTCAGQWVDESWPFAHTLLVATASARN